ncbi:DUF551 domain-containing protein [Yersinia enterocolitica]
MKELDSFTVERLEKWINTPEKYDHRYSPRINCDELRALAAIALAAKRAEPVGYLCEWDNGNQVIYYGEAGNALDDDWSSQPSVHKNLPIYTTPQLNSPEIPDGWIKCSDRMPEDDDFVLIWPLPDFGVELHVGQYIKFHKNGPGWFAQVYEHNYGVEFYPITVTHWMPLPAAPESE